MLPIRYSMLEGNSLGYFVLLGSFGLLALAGVFTSYLFGIFKSHASEISKQIAKHGGTQIRADLRLNTGVRYIGI